MGGYHFYSVVIFLNSIFKECTFVIGCVIIAKPPAADICHKAYELRQRGRLLENQKEICFI